MSKKANRYTTVALGLVLPLSANATLIDRGNGMIYDSDQDITWLQDANYAMSSGYDADGRMTWDAAMTWADQLTYGGYDDWRLVNANPSDTSCSDNFTSSGYDTQYYGHNCTGNELGHLFYIDLGLTPGQSILSGTDDDLELFSHIQSAYYWLGAEYAPNNISAWYFSTYNGYQNRYTKSSASYAWAVRSGDVTAIAVPESGALALLGVGLIGMVGVRRRRDL